MARGLLNLSEGWRAITLILSGFGVLVLPFLSLVTVFGSEFTLLVSQLFGINLWVVKLGPPAALAIFLLALVTLTRPDIVRAFESGGREPLAT